MKNPVFRGRSDSVNLCEALLFLSHDLGVAFYLSERLRRPRNLEGRLRCAPCASPCLPMERGLRCDRRHEYHTCRSRPSCDRRENAPYDKRSAGYRLDTVVWLLTDGTERSAGEGHGRWPLFRYWVDLEH